MTDEERERDIRNRVRIGLTRLEETILPSDTMSFASPRTVEDGGRERVLTLFERNVLVRASVRWAHDSRRPIESVRIMDGGQVVFVFGRKKP